MDVLEEGSAFLLVVEDAQSPQVPKELVVEVFFTEEDVVEVFLAEEEVDEEVQSPQVPDDVVEVFLADEEVVVEVFLAEEEVLELLLEELLVLQSPHPELVELVVGSALLLVEVLVVQST